MSRPRPQPTTDLTPATWLSEEIPDFGHQAGNLVPSRYEHLALVPHPGGEDEEGRPPPVLLATLCDVLAPHTGTPERCWFGLWDGWAWIDGGAGVMITSGGRAGSSYSTPSAFPREILDGPRVQLPSRDYLLLGGPLESALEIGYRSGELFARHHPELHLDPERWDPQPPSIFWPDDRAWFVASEIDLPYTYVAGSAELIADVLAAPGLEAVPARREDPLP